MTAAAPPGAALGPFSVLSFAYFTTIGLMNPYAPLWFQSLGFSTLAIGAIASLQSWTRVLSPYSWSWVGDHWQQGRRRTTLLRMATGSALVASCGLLFSRDYAAVATTVFLVFLANGAVMPLSDTVLAARLATAQGMDVRGYGRVRGWGSVGFIVSVTVCGALLQWLGIAALPAVAVAVSAALAFAAWRLPAAPGAASTAPSRSPAGPGVWQVMRRPPVRWFFASVFLTVLSHVSLYAFFSLYLVDLGYGKDAVGMLWAVAVALEIAFFWTQGRWFARWNAQAWLMAAAGAAALRFAAMAAFGGSLAVLVAGQLLHAVSFAAHHAACVATIDRHFPGALRGRGQALYSTIGYGASGVVGGLAGGAVSQRFGFAAVFAAAAGVALAALACAWRADRLERAGAVPSS